MASTSKAFKKCVDPCPRYLTPDDTHNCCIFCLGEEHTRDVLEGAICVHCELFSMKKLCSRLSRRYLRVRKLRPSQTSCPAYEELLEVMERATARLDLPWERTKMAAPREHLDERYQFWP